jgi:hypothetical protein
MLPKVQDNLRKWAVINYPIDLGYRKMVCD